MTTPQPNAQGVSDLIHRLRIYALMQRRRRSPENAKLADEAADLIDKLAARELQQAQVAGEGFVLVPKEVRELYEFMVMAFVPFTSQQGQIDISLTNAKRAMLAAKAATPQSSAPVVGEALLKRAYEVVHHELDCPSIGGNGDKDCKCDAVPFLRDLESALTGRG